MSRKNDARTSRPSERNPETALSGARGAPFGSQPKRRLVTRNAIATGAERWRMVRDKADGYPVPENKALSFIGWVYLLDRDFFKDAPPLHRNRKGWPEASLERRQWEEALQVAAKRWGQHRRMKGVLG